MTNLNRVTEAALAGDLPTLTNKHGTGSVLDSANLKPANEIQVKELTKTTEERKEEGNNSSSDHYSLDYDQASKSDHQSNRHREKANTPQLMLGTDATASQMGNGAYPFKSGIVTGKSAMEKVFPDSANAAAKKATTT